MKIWTIANPSTYPRMLDKPLFRSMLVTGTWSQKRCGSKIHSELTAPLVVSWEKDSTRTADVSWQIAGFHFVCSQRAKDLLTRVGDHFEFLPVKSNYAGFKGGPRQQIQDVTREVTWPVPKKAISIDPQKNGLVRQTICSNCELETYEFKIVDLIFDSSLIDRLDAFAVKQVGRHSPIFVTDEYKSALEALAVENVTFQLAGRAA